ncbi:leucine-rich repeat-containing protein 74A-like isoform X2 [Mya arenaria]|uniref:leucine-rich repeat-containing protein 74A-like isoform X2 n=1 Tax=Mya arenaria TaxID=6604 RepID=UPI0022E97587|nr:leucine-rich repeat-containing protein 74A-like isoform X2 [Mya arenaria]
MDETAEFPDTELSRSRKLGSVFRIIENHADKEDTDNGDTDDRRMRGKVRPHSAKGPGPNLELPSRVLPTKPRGIRPWSAQPKSAKAPPQRKVSRDSLRKPHFRPPSRSSTASVSSESSSLITAVGLANRKPLDSSTPEPHGDHHHSRCSHHHHHAHSKPSSSEKWAETISEALAESPEPEAPVKPVPEQRPMKKHPSFEQWIEGSPHDSDEYDTDVDIDDFVKRNVKEERPLDPTGTVMYMDQCDVQGQIPVSYIQRHLGDRNLRMRHHYLGGTGTKPMAVALVKNTVTEVLDISDNYVESEGARYIAGMMRNNTFITNLNISNNFIGKEGFSCICRMLETNTTLKILCVSGNRLTDSCAPSLVEALKNNSSLTSLNLSENTFGDFAGAYIGAALSLNEGLIDVDLSWNSIRNRGAAAMLSCLTKNKTLEVLDLSWNGLGALGAEALKQGLKINNTLKVLDISNNRLSTKAAEAISWGLARNAGLNSLMLNLNPLKDAGVAAILKAVEKNTELRLLSIEEIGISRENYSKIQELQANKDLTILHGGVGGYNRATTATSVMRLFSKFVGAHQKELATAFHQYDMDRNGLLGLEDVKMALKDAGLRLTSRQLSTLVEELNYTNSGTLNYRDIISGQALRDFFSHHPARALAIKSSQITINTIPEMLHRQLTVT